MITKEELERLEYAMNEALRKKAEAGRNTPLSLSPWEQIEYEKTFKESYEQAKTEYYNAKAFYHFERHEWEQFCKAVLLDRNTMELCFICGWQDKLPDSYYYDFVVSSYTHWGDSMPKVRKAVYGLKKHGAAKLPAELDGLDVITVYRGCVDDIHWVKNAISWTMDINEAKHFKQMAETFKHQPARVYQGKIRREHVLAYTNERNESEIIQHGHVYGIKDITDEVMDEAVAL